MYRPRKAQNVEQCVKQPRRELRTNRPNYDLGIDVVILCPSANGTFSMTRDYEKNKNLKGGCNDCNSNEIRSESSRGILL